MDEEKRLSLFGFLALLAFLAFLAFLIWQIRQQARNVISAEDIERAREIVRRMERV